MSPQDETECVEKMHMLLSMGGLPAAKSYLDKHGLSARIEDVTKRIFDLTFDSLQTKTDDLQRLFEFNPHASTGYAMCICALSGLTAAKELGVHVN